MIHQGHRKLFCGGGRGGGGGRGWLVGLSEISTTMAGRRQKIETP